MKKTYTFKTGLKKQHNSIMRIESFRLDDQASDNEIKDYISFSNDGAPHTRQDKLIALYDFVSHIMNERAKELKIPSGTEVNSRTAVELGPVFFAGHDAHHYLKGAMAFMSQNDIESAFNMLLSAIPSLLDVQLLANEDLLLAGNSKSAQATIDKKEKAQKRKKEAWPIFVKYWKKTGSRTRAGELTARDLNNKKEPEEKDIKPRTIRGYFEGMPKPD